MKNKTALKRILALFAALALIFSLTAVCFAAESGEFHVIDAAGVLNDSQIDELEKAIEKAREESGVDFYFVTVKDFTAYGYGEDDVSEFTMDILFDKDVFGVKESDSASILVFSTEARDFCTYSTQPVYDIVKGEIEEYIEEYEILPCVKNGKDDYFSAALAFIEGYSDAVSNNGSVISPQVDFNSSTGNSSSVFSGFGSGMSVFGIAAAVFTAIISLLFIFYLL
ncbi:MAG: TPM domain-containing protein [Clostridia bacterium]|nr:TPM domain-containing protein [Clostridia bacterium]